MMCRMAEAVAITREVSSALGQCELTHLARVHIDVALARTQHAAYERALVDAGFRIERLPSTPDMPDAVFVEDIAVVFEEVALVTRPGAVSRRAEVPAIADALSQYREVRRIEPPATLDGGDVLVTDRRVFVGLSSRTNREAVRQMRRILTPFGYEVCEVTVGDCLHLKSAATAISAHAVLLNPNWIDQTVFDELDVVTVDPSEPSAANALKLRDRVIFPSAFPRTCSKLRSRGLRVETVEASELAKAEGAVTCCSLILE
jgi:dimethylargininase